MIITSYNEIKDRIQTGDCIVWNGWGHNLIEFFYSCGIKIVTGPPTHISTATWIGGELWLWESMWQGQVFDLMDRRIAMAEKEHWQQAWWLPLKDELRDQFKESDSNRYMIKKVAEGTEYATIKGLKSGFPRFFYNEPSDDKLFCSESHMFALQAGGILKSVNPSIATPVDVCAFDIHQEQYSIFWRKDIFNKVPRELTINTKRPVL